MKINLAEQLILYQSNVLPVLLAKISEQLGVSERALTALEIGYAPRIQLEEKKDGQPRCLYNCWVTPERDEKGDVIGLSLRQWNGKKYMVPGSKRGLIYVPNVHHSPIVTGKYQAGPQNWSRTSETILCPICGKPDWCLVSAENPDDPKAVLCCRIKEGAVKSLGTAGYLHILKVEGELTEAGSVLLPSEHPLLIVEGMTDVAAALDIDMVAVGRPSSTGCLDKLSQLIAGRDVVVLGENDAGAGKEGMEKAFEVLRPASKTISMLMPPEGIKDLRQWITQGVSQDMFLGLARTEGETAHENRILASIAPMELAKQFLEATYYQDEIFTLRVYHGSWYAYNGQCYKEIDKIALRQQLYQYLGNKQFKKLRTGGFDILNFDPTRYKVDEIMDAFAAWCPIRRAEIPCWLDKDHHSDPKHILVFSNGYIDIDEYTKGAFPLHEPTPRFFSLSSYPYAFDPDATHVLWDKFLNELFTDDPLKITLLQEWFGYNLIPDNSQEKFVMLLGPTRAGKGTILDVLTFILGEDQVLATSFKDYTRRFAIFPFLGKLAAVIGDVSVGSNYDATEALNILKRITGNDVIMIERKGKDITQTCIKLYARFTMAANIMPQLPDFARTIESRMLVIKFLKSFMGREDTTLKYRLRQEAPGILLWALEGLRRLQKNKDFTLPASHGQVLRRVRSEITPFVEFIEDYCTLGESDDHYIMTQHLYNCWKEWAIEHGEKLRTIRWLAQSILALYPGTRLTRRVTAEGRKRILYGIRLRSDVMRRMGYGQ